MTKEELDKIKDILEYGDIKYSESKEYYLTETGLKKVLAEIERLQRDIIEIGIHERLEVK